MKFLIVNTLIIALALMIHYEILYRLSVLMPKLKVRAHSRVVIGVFGAIFAHIIEIWLFALSFYFMHHNNWGQLSGNYDGSLMASATSRSRPLLLWASATSNLLVIFAISPALNRSPDWY